MKTFSRNQIFYIKKSSSSVYVNAQDPRGTDLVKPGKLIRLEPLTKIITLGDDPGEISGPNNMLVEIRECLTGSKYYMHRAILLQNCKLVKIEDQFDGLLKLAGVDPDKTINFGRYKIIDSSLRNLNGHKSDLVILEEDYGDKNPKRLTIEVSSLPALTGNKDIEGLSFELRLVPLEEED